MKTITGISRGLDHPTTPPARPSTALPSCSGGLYWRKNRSPKCPLDRSSQSASSTEADGFEPQGAYTSNLTIGDTSPMVGRAAGALRKRKNLSKRHCYKEMIPGAKLPHTGRTLLNSGNPKAIVLDDEEDFVVCFHLQHFARSISMDWLSFQFIFPTRRHFANGKFVLLIWHSHLKNLLPSLGQTSITLNQVQKRTI